MPRGGNNNNGVIDFIIEYMFNTFIKIVEVPYLPVSSCQDRYKSLI